MVDINSKTEQVRVNVSSVGNKGNVSLDLTQNYYEGLAKKWAISDGLVNGEDYSSKYYAKESKKQADLATEKATIATNKGDEVIEGCNKALSKISAQETISKNAVKAEGDTQVARIQAEGSNLATKAEAKYTAGAGISIENNVIANTQTSAEWGNIQGNIQSQNDLIELINNKGGSLELATIVCMPFGVDESENKYRYLNGQVIIQEQYPAFTAKVKSWQATRPNLFTTEQNWQAEKTASKLGQSGKFVVDNAAGTIRLPLVININGLTDLANCGLIKDESLPNITLYQTGAAGSNMGTKNGALIYTPGGVGVQGTSSSDVNSHGTFDFNASRSSSTYQDNAPVQQEAIQYPYVIVVNTGVTETERPINNYQVNNVYSYGVSQYYKGTMNNNSWLRSAGQWNNGTIYNGLYGWILEQLNNSADGFATSDSSYTDYDWVINTTDQTFRLPLKNGMEGVFASGVKGNGITLGLTDGTDFGGLNSGAITTTSNILFARKAVYGKAVGSLGETGLLETARSLGLTPDPTKSGIVVDTTIPEGYNLYYYVGETVQNSNLIDAGRIGEELGNKTNTEQAASASVPNYEKAYLYQATLSTIFTAPCDGILMGSIATGRDAGNSFIDIYNPDGQIINTIPYGYSGADVNQYTVNIKLLKDYSAKATCSPGGDIYYVTTDHTMVAGKLQFIPLKGAN